MGVQRLVETFSVVVLVFHAMSVSAYPSTSNNPCDEKGNGALLADLSKGCHAFFLCWGYEAHSLSCDDTCAFNEAAGHCVPSDACHSGGRIPAFCDHGQYMVYPGDRSKYVQYGVNTATLKQCPYGLIFDTYACTCNYDYRGHGY